MVPVLDGDLFKQVPTYRRRPARDDEDGVAEIEVAHVSALIETPPMPR
jgi:hypothetical protein